MQLTPTTLPTTLLPPCTPAEARRTHTYLPLQRDLFSSDIQIDFTDLLPVVKRTRGGACRSPGVDTFLLEGTNVSKRDEGGATLPCHGQHLCLRGILANTPQGAPRARSEQLCSQEASAPSSGQDGRTQHHPTTPRHLLPPHSLQVSMVNCSQPPFFITYRSFALNHQPNRNHGTDILHTPCIALSLTPRPRPHRTDRVRTATLPSVQPAPLPFCVTSYPFPAERGNARDFFPRSPRAVAVRKLPSTAALDDKKCQPPIRAPPSPAIPPH